MSNHQSVCGRRTTMKSSRLIKPTAHLFLMLSSTLIVILLAQVATADAMWWFNGFNANQQSPARQPTKVITTSTQPPPVVSRSVNMSQAIAVQQLTEQLQKHSLAQETVVEQAPGETVSQVQQQQQPLQQQVVQQEALEGGAGYSSYGSNLLSIAGIQPSSIASLLNTVGDTGFRYFNIQDQCRNRAACDLGNMLYKRLSFVHNWLIRTSVRTIIDMNNVYAQSWLEGMLGRNCTLVYATCRQSPLEGLMNLAILQHLAM